MEEGTEATSESEYNYTKLNPAADNQPDGEDAPKTESNPNSVIAVQSGPPSENKGYAILSLIVGLIIAFIGVYVAYKDAGVVGGDAYNYIIGAGRGAAIAGVGIVFALIGLANAVFHVAKTIEHTSRK